MTRQVPKRACVLGAGRGSAELVDFLVESGCTDVVVLDDRHGEGLQVGGVAARGPLQDAAACAAAGYEVLSGIANSTTRGLRTQISDRLALPPGSWGRFVHPSAHVSTRARLEPGVIVYPGVCVATDAVLERQAVVYYNSVVHHDAIVGAGAILCAGVLVAGAVRIGAGSYIGVGAVVRDRVSIGARALVGMGAVVVADVADDATVKGLPAR